MKNEPRSLFRKAARFLRLHRMASFTAAQALVLGIDRVPGGNGITFRVPRDFAGEDFANLWMGTYEQAELSLVREFFKPSRTIIDLGANIGFVSSHAFQEKLTPRGEIVCVEANPASLACLQDNMMQTTEKSKHGKNMSFLPLALVDEGGPETVSFVKLRNLSSHIMVEGEQLPQGAEVVTVNTITMSDLASSFAPADYSLICDIEGGETALFNAQDALSRCTQMVVELHEGPLAEKGYTLDDAVARFEEMGFEFRGQAKNSYAFTR